MKQHPTWKRALKGTALVPAAFVCLLLAAPAVAAPDHSARLAQTLREGGDVSAGDLDGDHLSDLVLTARGTHLLPGSQHRLDISLSKGTWSQTFHFPFRRGGLAIAARDVDGDVDLDLVVTSRLTGEGVGILINDGTGVFSEGDIGDREPWVWGHGVHLIAGSSQEMPSVAVPSCSDDVATAASNSAPAPGHASSGMHYRGRSVSVRTRGAFFIRPPPASV